MLKLIKLKKYVFLEQAGMTEHGRQIDIELNYEHNLNRPTFNMCKGQFGRGSMRLKKNNIIMKFFECLDF